MAVASRRGWAAGGLARTMLGRVLGCHAGRVSMRATAYEHRTMLVSY